MKTVFQFLKPYRRLCVFTIFAMLLDVAGGLFVPKLTADMINIGVKSGNMEYIIEKGIAMLAVTILAGTGALLGSWLCADLSAKLGRVMRNAVYEKSLTFSEHDFSRFGTGSMITRTLNDINIIQQSVVWCIQMVLPVPAVCVMGVAMAFAVDTMMGFLLIGVTVLIIVLALIVTRRASQIFGRLQQLLDRMNVVLRENLTGVRVIRAFRKEKDEEKRMRKSFEDYAETSISANLLFAGLESTAFFVINICIVAILWLGGDRIGAGYMEIGDITALTEYSILILFYILGGFVILGRSFITVWAGPGYEEVYRITLLLICPVMIPLIQNLGIEIQRALNRHRFRSLVYLAVAAGNLAVSIPLTRIFGPTGAAAGTCAGLLIGNGLIMNLYDHFQIGLDMLRFWKEILRLLLPGSAALAGGYLLGYCIGTDSLAGFLVSGVSYTALYAALQWGFGMNEKEKDIARIPLAKWIRRCTGRKEIQEK